MSLLSELTRYDARGNRYTVCLECRSDVMYKTMLCATCYQQAYRNGYVWQYIENDYFRDESEEDQDRLDMMIEWIFTYDVDRLERGLKEFIPGWWSLYHTLGFIGPKTGSSGYGLVVDGYVLCTNCEEHEIIVGRGLCARCYMSISYGKGSTETDILDYPTQAYVKNVDGYVWFVLNHHFDRVKDIAKRFGVHIVQ